jgi:hypothetical protein
VNSDDMHEYVSKAVARDMLTQQRWAEAEPVARQVLGVAGRILGAESPQLLNALGLLAPCLPPTERVALRERALRITEKACRNDHRNPDEKPLRDPSREGAS